jgi:Copper type II ascorbate-dependent monooxygenase, C-terminal domain
MENSSRPRFVYSLRGVYMRLKTCVLTVSFVWMGALASVSTDGQYAGRRAVGKDVPTFSKDVAPIIFKNCAGCHRPGEIAPMSLLTYEDARPWAKAIRDEVGDHNMPPWHADAPRGTFHNERYLSDADRQTLIAWANGGAPRGDAKDLPPTPAFVDGWAVGKPDVVLEMQEDYKVPADGTIQYEYFYIPTNFTEAKWVKSIEVRPGNREVVHHVLAYYRAKPDVARTPVLRPNKENSNIPKRREVGERPPRADLRELPQRIIATYAPGTNPQVAPQGTAFRLEPDGIIELQMHYTTMGEATSDRTKVGLVFATEPSPLEVRAGQFINAVFTLPAGAANVEVSTDVDFVQDATVWGIFPHTHLRGKKWDYKLVLPTGETKTILSVPKYDFNWQTYYMFKEPLQIPKGARIISTAWYDNSPGNKFNPNPKVDVGWGDQTWEEMQYTGLLYSSK